MTNEKNELKNFFKEREEFLNSLRDEKLYNTYNCPKHNVFVRVGIDCPLCLLEKNKKAVEVSSENEEKEKRKKEEKTEKGKEKKCLTLKKKPSTMKQLKGTGKKKEKGKQDTGLFMDWSEQINTRGMGALDGYTRDMICLW